MQSPSHLMENGDGVGGGSLSQSSAENGKVTFEDTITSKDSPTHSMDGRPFSRSTVDSDNTLLRDVWLQNVIRCFICKELLGDQPKALPGCLHSFCLQCIEQSISPSHDTEFICPKCCTPSKLGPDGPKSWLTCRELATLAEIARNPPTDPKPKAEQAVCKHRPYRNNVCPHCSVAFCKICVVRHLESIKSKVISIGNSLQPRYDEKIADLEKTVGDTSQLEQNTMLDDENQISQGFTWFREQLKWQFDEQELFLCDSVEKAVATKIDDVQVTVEKAKACIVKVEEIESAMNAKPVEDMAIEELCEMCAMMRKCREEVECAEKLTMADLAGQVVFDRDDVKKGLLQTLDESINSEKCCQFLNILAFEHAQAFEDAIWKLHEAAKSGNFEQVRGIFESSEWSASEIATFIEHCDDTQHSRTLLHQACSSGSLDMVTFLVERHAKLDALDTGSTIPLYLAAFAGHVEIVRFLLPELEKAFPDHFFDFETDALRFAITHGHPKIVDLMVTRNHHLLSYKHEFLANFGETWLHFAVLKNQMTVVVCLVKNGIEIGAVDMNGNTALHYACKNGSKDIAQYLADYLLEMNPSLLYVRNNNGETPFDLDKTGQMSAILNALSEKMAQCAVQQANSIQVEETTTQPDLDILPDELMEF